MDHDKAISISQIQCAAVDFILKEINEAELKLTELKKVYHNYKKYNWYKNINRI